jgi:hypothetical protein
MKQLLPLLALLCVYCVNVSAADHWPQFRGPNAAGVGANANLPDKWSATENVAWKTDLPGRSWSSPIVWDGKVFVTAVVNTGESEPPKKGLYFGGNRPEPPKSEHESKVFCLDLATGKILWDRTVHRGAPQTAIHLKSSYGAEKQDKLTVTAARLSADDRTVTLDIADMLPSDQLLIQINVDGKDGAPVNREIYATVPVLEPAAEK